MTEATTPEPTAPVPANERVAKVFDALWNDSKMGRDIRAKAKEMYPDIVLPEDQMTPIFEPLKAELDEYKKQFEELKAEREAERKEREEASMKVKLEDAINSARDKYSLTSDGFDKMVERMKETGNYTDADAAAAWVAQQTPVKSVNKADWLPRKANFLGAGEVNTNEKFKLLHTNPEGYLEAELQEFVNDPDRYVAETFGA